VVAQPEYDVSGATCILALVSSINTKFEFALVVSDEKAVRSSVSAIKQWGPEVERAPDNRCLDRYGSAKHLCANAQHDVRIGAVENNSRSSAIDGYGVRQRCDEAANLIGNRVARCVCEIPRGAERSEIRFVRRLDLWLCQRTGV
jgi:hypothetical protein